MNTENLPKRERLERISSIVLSNGEASLEELCELLGVSRMTIHRDLEELENRGVLRKVRNGATAQPSSAFESNIEFRLTCAPEKKERLARHAASLVEPGDVILIDETTTALPIVRYLAEIEGLTVVTNFQPVANAVAKIVGIRLIGLGGEYIHQYDTFSGPLCEHQVLQLRINRYFTSTTAIEESGAYHPNSMIASVKKAMIQVSARKYLLADTSKFDRTALHKFAELIAFDQILVDAPLPAKKAEGMQHIADRLMVVPQQSKE